jgi:RHS repeat-associated protein
VRRVLPLLVTLVALCVGVAGAPLPPAPAGAQQADPPSVPEFDSPFPDMPPIESADPPANAGPLSPPVPADTVDAEPTDVDRARQEARDSGERVAIPSEWTETTAVYAEPDGTITEEISAGPVRVADGDGWVPVDPTLVETPEGVEPAAIPSDVVLSDGGAEPLLEVAGAEPAGAEPADGESVTVDVAGTLPEPEIDGAVATYPEAIDGSDLVVTARNVGAEVSIVIPDAAAAQDSYELAVASDGYEVEQVEGGGLEFTDADGAVVGTQTAPVMFDATDSGIPGLAANPGPVTSELVERDGAHVLVIEPDAGYLADPDTQFPVTIDPLSDILTATADTAVFASVPTQTNDSATSLHTGYTAFTNAARTFIKFGTSSFEGKQVIDADLDVYQEWSGSCTPTPLAVRYANDFPNTGTTWNTQPTVSATNIDQIDVAGNSSCPTLQGWKTLDVTSLAQTWATNTATTGALTLRANESNPSYAKAFRSRETTQGPKLTVSYLVAPSTPINLVPANGTTVTTLRPTLKARINLPGYGGGLVTYFRVLEGGAEVVKHDLIGTSGTDVQWSVPADELRVGHTYTWGVTACDGIFPTECSAEATRTFTVNPGMASGIRPYFTYDSTGVSDRSGLQVNVGTGNLSVTTSDMTMAGVDSPLALARTYNSLGRENGMFGQRWTGSYTSSIRLVPEPDGSFVYYGPTGEAVRIAKSGSTYTPSGDLDARFVDGGGYFGIYVLEFNHDRGAFKAGDQLLFQHPDSATPAGPDYALWGLRSRNSHTIFLTYAGTTPGSAITSVTDTQSRVVSYSTSSGRITSQSHGGRSVGFTYDGNGDLDTVTDAEGNVTNYDYSGHLLTKITSPGSRVIDITYDTRGRATSVKRTVSGVVEESTYTYTDDAVNNLFKTAVRDANLNTTNYWSDHAARVKEAYDPFGQKVATSYDDNSNVISVTDTGSNTYTYGWSSNNRNNLETVELPTGATATSTYDTTASSGLRPYQPESSNDAQGNATDYTFDSSGNFQRADLATGAFEKVERHGIDGVTCTNGRQGQVCKAYNANNKVTTFAYETDGDLDVITPPSPLGAWEMDYDAFGRVTLIDDGRGTDKTYAYDDLDRMLTAQYNGGSTVTFAYDAYGNTTDRTDGVGAWGMDHDEANRLLEIDGPTPPTGFPTDLHDVAFTYDKVGNLLSLTDVGGTTDYTFTAVNMVDTITDPDAGVTDYAYGDPTQPTWLTSIEFPNGARTDIDYDGSGRVTGWENRDGDDSIFTDLGYEFTQGSNDTTLRRKVTRPGSSTAYTYDSLNRLDTAVTTLNGGGTASSYDYAYDAAGNRTQAIVNGSTSNATYNNADQLTTTGVVHDANGNMTAGGAHGYTTLAYNLLDQTSSVTPKNMSARAQEYAGQLQSTWIADAGTRFASAGSVGITATATTSTLTTFVRDPGGRLISMERGGDRSYYHHDGRGSVVALTDEAGDVVQAYEYEPYGRIATGTIGTLTQPFRWNSEYAINDYDYKIGARWYDASIARWTQRDPAAKDPNPYAFAGDDPINKSDPSGLGWQDVAGDIVDGAAEVSDWVGGGKLVYDVVFTGESGIGQEDKEDIAEFVGGAAFGIACESVLAASSVPSGGASLAASGGCVVGGMAAGDITRSFVDED